jgi:hypothetical protein
MATKDSARSCWQRRDRLVAGAGTPEEESLQKEIDAIRQMGLRLFQKVDKMESLLKKMHEKGDPWDTYENKKVRGPRKLKLFKISETNEMESLTLQTHEGVTEAEKLGWVCKGELRTLQPFEQDIPETIAYDCQALAVAERNRKIIGTMAAE